MATFAPSAARRLAIAAPMPREPPVTIATFPSSFLDIRFSHFSLTAFFADPVAYVGRAVGQRDARYFTAPEKSNSVNIDQIQFFQVQHDLRFALPNLLLQLGQVLRAHPTYQSKSRAVLVRVLLDFQRHAWLSNDSPLSDGNPGATRNQLSRWCLAFELRL